VEISYRAVVSLTMPPPLRATSRSPIERWALDPHTIHLNHGSYGGCLRTVLETAQQIRARVEAAPMKFFVLDWQHEIDRARAALAGFVHAPAERLVFVPGATTGVAIALHSIAWSAGDEIVVTDHGYRACRNQVERLAATRGLSISTVSITLPFDPDQLVAAIATAITPRTRAVLLDHVTSPSALVLPVERIVPVLAARGIVTIVDGAHAPGQLALDLAALGATYYTGNCHKWLCGPKGSGFLVIADGAPGLPLVTSHGASPEYGPANRLHAELDWAGTHDPSAQLAVPAAITDVEREGGDWPQIRARNHDLVIEMRRRFVDALARGGSPTAALAPETSLGAMASVRVALPAGLTAAALEQALLATGWEVPIVDTPKGALVRLSAHLYNYAAEAEDLARELHARGVRLR
jgi:isopenicillin-N epimerase